ncbi:MAG: hypothetical protein FWD11_08245 [Micrococcales bacterium]|nr:hypothetical protein [Micrococcales bacterium]
MTSQYDRAVFERCDLSGQKTADPTRWPACFIKHTTEGENGLHALATPTALVAFQL